MGVTSLSRRVQNFAALLNAVPTVGDDRPDDRPTRGAACPVLPPAVLRACPLRPSVDRCGGVYRDAAIAIVSGSAGASTPALRDAPAVTLAGIAAASTAPVCDAPTDVVGLT